MPEPSAPSGLPDGPTPNRVPSGGVSSRVAAVVAVGALAVGVAVGALAVIVALGPVGQGVDAPRGSPTEIGLSAPQPTPVPTPEKAEPASLGPPADVASPGPSADVAPPVPSCDEIAPTAGTPLPDEAGARPGDAGDGPLPLGAVEDVPNPDRLDFLYTTAECFRDAHWMEPGTGRGSGTWTAGRPFHVREGFINNGAEPLGAGFDVVLYVTRLDGDGQGATFRFESDYVLRGPTDRCGPTYTADTGPQTCEWFVHDFPAGLPEGRFAIWAVWLAPCKAWIDLGLADDCADPDEVISLFGSGFDAPYSQEAPTYDGPPAT